MNPTYSNPGGHEQMPNVSGQMAGYGRIVPGMFGDRTIGGGGLNDPLGPRELANDIFQSNNGKLKGSLQQLGRMRSMPDRHPYNADELAVTESYLRDLATKPFKSQREADEAAYAAQDAADQGTGGLPSSIDFKSSMAKRKPQE